MERSGSTAIPYPDSLPFLLKTINNDLKQEAAARQVEVAIKVAAAVGVNYQVTLGIEDPQRPQVLATMLKVLRAPTRRGDKGTAGAGSRPRPPTSSAGWERRGTMARCLGVGHLGRRPEGCSRGPGAALPGR